MTFSTKGLCLSCSVPYTSSLGIIPPFSAQQSWIAEASDPSCCTHLQGAMRTSTELIAHWKLDLLCTSTSFAAEISKVLVPTVTTTDCPPGTGPALNNCAK